MDTLKGHLHLDPFTDTQVVPVRAKHRFERLLREEERTREPAHWRSLIAIPDSVGEWRHDVGELVDFSHPLPWKVGVQPTGQHHHGTRLGVRLQSIELTDFGSEFEHLDSLVLEQPLDIWKRSQPEIPFHAKTSGIVLRLFRRGDGLTRDDSVAADSSGSRGSLLSQRSRKPGLSPRSASP